MKGFLRSVGFCFLVLLVAGGAGVLGLSSVIAYQVFQGDYSQLEKSTILARINEETTLYYRNGETAIGSFFDSSHRTYVEIDRIPAHMIRAMVASEDKNFYNHVGVDPIAIFGAFFEGLSNGLQFRRGGSTITQQTVKNIMDRWEPTFRRKFTEMIRALQLERIYSKNEILEFYLNQFHVTANGNGIGIAAKYYFNKQVEDLTLVEAAFIAGSVKAPSKYNPFTKYTKEARDKAWENANERKNYVLRRMFEQGWIDKEELEEAWGLKVPFKKGRFTSKEVALVSVLRGQLNKKEILEALNLDSVNEMNQAGLKIYTTIDHDLQDDAQRAMRRNLSRLEYILEGFKVEDPKRFHSLRDLEVGQFYFGKVAKVVKGKQPEIEVDFGLPVGVIPTDSLKRTAKILNLPTYKGEDFHLEEILSTVKVGDVLLSEVKEYDRAKHRAILELKKYPTINGGLIAVDKGKVRAVVAGFEAKGFNRAMFATRQPGSVFKSVIYFAALQLGWSILDQLENDRQVFPFQGHLYFPRPDHVSPYSQVSMAWSGVKSENLASINLAANLVDRLNFGQFKQLLGHLDLLPMQGESVSDYHYRVSKATGVQVNSEGVKEHLLTKAIRDLKPDMVFSGEADLYKNINKMWWGNGYTAELHSLHAQPEQDLPESELQKRVDMLHVNYERFLRLSADLEKDWAAIGSRVLEAGAEGAMLDPSVLPLIARFRVLSSVGNTPKLGYERHTQDEEAFLAAEHKREAYLPPIPGRALNALDVQMIWGASGFLGEQAGINYDDVMISGILPNSYLKRIQSNLEMRYEAVMARGDNYGLYRYFNHHDFRIAAGLNYVVNLSRAMGVYSKLEPVLSFPLGTNVVSVAEVAKIYQTFAAGKTFRFYKDGPDNQLSFIERIEDRAGNVLYEPKATEFQLVEPCVSEQIGEILQKVVTHGTGRRARGELQITLEQGDKAAKGDAKKDAVASETKIRIPAFGKTGTTNDYTTAYFSGYIPYPVENRQPLSAKNSMVIASYVGYDLNRTMRRGGYKITGAYGALPIWSDFGRLMLEDMDYKSYVDEFDLSLMKKRVWPLASSRCGKYAEVDLPRGIVMGGNGESQFEVFDPTDIERDGEIFTNEFARNSSVRSFVTLPESYAQSTRPLALFSLPSSKDGSVSDAVTDENDLDSDGGGLDHPDPSTTNPEGSAPMQMGGEEPFQQPIEAGTTAKATKPAESKKSEDRFENEENIW